MKPERIRGTYYRTFRKLVSTVDYVRRRIVLFDEGHIYSGTRSLHLTPSGRRIQKLNRLRFRHR